MKKTLFSLFTAVSLALLYCPAAFALTEDEAAAAVDAHGKDAVSGNLFLWLLCAIAFLKVSTKLDGILHSLGIGVSRSPGSMLSEALLAFRGFEIGKAFMGLGAAKAAASTATAKATPSNTFAGGLSGMVSRHVQQSTASSISGQSGGIGTSLGGAMYHNSLGKDGGFAVKSSALSPPGRQAAVLQVTAPWKRSMAILPVPATRRPCQSPPLVKVSLLQWQWPQMTP